ncbi:GyrI-like domain-containing protein [Oxalobacteraceae bacterium A2-2]
MSMQIQELPDVKVAYLRYKGAFGPALGEFWAEVFQPWQQAFHLTGRVTYGVTRDDPHTTPENECRYDACVAVDDNYRTADPARDAVLPGGRYATVHFKGTADQVPQAWQDFVASVEPAGHAFDPARPCFERYAADYAMGADGVFESDLFIPVQ